MHGFLAAHDLEKSVDEFLSFVVRELTKYDPAAQMFVAVGIAPGATKRTFTCDFY